MSENSHLDPWRDLGPRWRTYGFALIALFGIGAPPTPSATRAS